MERIKTGPKQKTFAQITSSMPPAGSSSGIPDMINSCKRRNTMNAAVIAAFLFHFKSSNFFGEPINIGSNKTIFIKDLVKIMKKFSNDTSPGVTLYNACYPEPHSIREICQTISNVTNVKIPWVRIPAILLKTIASLLYSCGKLFGMEFIGIHPDRVKKLMVSTNVLGRKLNDKFKLNYSLNEALEDWYTDCDNDGLY